MVALVGDNVGGDMPVIHRVDKFVVPDAVRERFWEQVRRTHAVLRQQPGFLDDALLEHHSGPGRFNVVTVVRWASEDALADAKAAVDELHRADGFLPADFFRGAGIEADLANYVALPH